MLSGNQNDPKKPVSSMGDADRQAFQKIASIMGTAEDNFMQVEGQEAGRRLKFVNPKHFGHLSDDELGFQISGLKPKTATQPGVPAASTTQGTPATASTSNAAGITWGQPLIGNAPIRK